VNKKKLTIGVTGLNAIDSPGPGVAVIRALREWPDVEVRIIGLIYEALEPGIYMPGIADKCYQIPYPSAGTEALLMRLNYIHEKEQLDLIIPNFDAELFNFIKISSSLEQSGIKTFLPTTEQFEARDKRNLYQFGLKHDLIVPRDRIIYSVAELAPAAEAFGYPLIVKGKFYEAYVCNTIDQAKKAYHQLEAKWGLPIIVQEFISGTEVNVAALGDGKGNCISAVAMRKLYITDKGKAWAGVTLEDQSLIALAEKFISASKWKGGFELEIIRSVEGKLYILEINPRFPAWIYLTVAAGHNQPAALAMMALGEEVQPMGTYNSGIVFVRYAWDQITNIETFQQFSAFGEN